MELVLVLFPPTLINHVTNFKIDIEVKGSGHAPVTVTLDMKDVCPFTSQMHLVKGPSPLVFQFINMRILLLKKASIITVFV